jgi:hypothetical protein
MSWHGISVFHYLVARYANGSGYDTSMVLNFCSVTHIRNISWGCIFCKLHGNVTISCNVNVLQLENIQWFV